jgi:hypothetical protein
MKRSGMKARLAAPVACTTFVAMAVAALAVGTARGDAHVVAVCDAKKTGSLRVVDGQNRRSSNKRCVSSNPTGSKGNPGIVDSAGPAGNTDATGRDGVLEEIGDKGADGASGPAGAQGEQGPEGDNGAPDGDKGAHRATGPSGAHKGLRGDNGASGAKGDSGHPRAPPEALSALRTGPGA